MAETPLDLSKLPCPQGCRWEESIIRPFHGVTRSFSLIIGNHPIACVCIGENGDVSHRTGNLWSFVHGFWSVDAAVDSVLMTLGLTPAPAPERTFTDHDLQTVAEAAYKAGMRHDPEKVAPFDYTEIVEAALTAAIGHGSKERTFTEAEMVREFHDAFGVPISDSHECPNLRRCTLRMELIDEEVAELKKAHESGRAEEIAKELADVVYVCHGMALEYGIDLGTVFRAVHRSNMSKLGPDGKPVLREDGKVLKGPNYSAPDIAAALRIETKEPTDGKA